MTDHEFFPPTLELSPAEIGAHKQHLLSEIAGKPKRSRRPLFAAIAAAGAAAALAVGLLPSTGSRTSTPLAASLRSSPLVVFHSSVASRTPDVRNYPLDRLIGDHTVSWLGVNHVTASRKDIPTAVLQLAAAQARSFGNGGPTRVEWMKTTRQTAVAAENAGHVDGGSLPVYFVILHGHFGGETASSPHGATLARARVLTDTIEIKDGRILDFGIGNREPSFAKTGKPHHFVLDVRRRSR